MSYEPYRVRIVETPAGFAMMTLDLWIVNQHPDGTQRILRSGGTLEPMPPRGAVLDIEPTLQLPVDSLPFLRDELERVMTGRLPASTDYHAARAEVMSEALDFERARVDRAMTSLLMAVSPLTPDPPS